MKRVYFLSHEFKLSISSKSEKSPSGHGLCRCDFIMAINCLLKSTCLADYLVILILKEDFGNIQCILLLQEASPDYQEQEELTTKGFYRSFSSSLL